MLFNNNKKKFKLKMKKNKLKFRMLFKLRQISDMCHSSSPSKVVKRGEKRKDTVSKL